jgi:hypothetical protein
MISSLGSQAARLGCGAHPRIESDEIEIPIKRLRISRGMEESTADQHQGATVG